MINIAVFASGNGTNFENLIKQNDIHANFCILISDNKEANALKIASEHNIDSFSFTPKEYISKREYEKEIEDIIDKLNIDLIVLAGYMRILSEEFTQKYEGRIINIHPSLLPLYKGKNAIQDAYLDGKNIFGVTVHYVICDVDAGEIIIQDKVLNTNGLTLSEVTKKVHELEYILYPKALKMVIEKIERGE